jgi:hypothetical protein
MTSTGPIATRPENGPIEEMTVDELRLFAQRLEAENAAMRPIVLRVAEARICRDAVTMIESCPHCSLRRGATLGYGGVHDENCVVSQARRLGF